MQSGNTEHRRPRFSRRSCWGRHRFRWSHQQRAISGAVREQHRTRAPLQQHLRPDPLQQNDGPGQHRIATIERRFCRAHGGHEGPAQQNSRSASGWRVHCDVDHATSGQSGEVAEHIVQRRLQVGLEGRHGDVVPPGLKMHADLLTERGTIRSHPLLQPVRRRSQSTSNPHLGDWRPPGKVRKRPNTQVTDTLGLLEQGIPCLPEHGGHLLHNLGP
mmetsp:Transcript_89741/g.240754  ORF Transcript_89741/g.240754 Transcript_89741/m.240754 type:complete len:216 (-) Transcript_89741:203-850(-)